MKDVFERWIPIWHAFFYGMIAIATLIAAPRTPHVTIAVALALAAWHAVVLARAGRSVRAHPRTVGVYLAGAIVLADVLLTYDGIYLLVAMSIYNQIFAFLAMRWAIPSAVVLTGNIAFLMIRGANSVGGVLVVVGSLAALMFAVFFNASAEENRRRRELIEELERTREQLAFAERLAGMTDERSRLQRDLHDTVTQHLIGIVMTLEARAKDDATTEVLDLARAALADARRLVWDERPRELEDGSLTLALRAIGAKSKGVVIEMELGEGLDAVPVRVQTSVVRCVQEALTNVKKHAKASRVTISVEVAGDTLMLDVRDDGVGFDVEEVAESMDGSGFGLRGLRERAAELGGTVAIESKRGHGTSIAIHLPLPRTGA